MPKDDPYWVGHRTRLRDKARAVGIEELRPYEIVELMLYPSEPRADMTDLARALVERFGSIGALLSASRDELMGVRGMTRPAADWIMRTAELTRHFLAADAMPQPRIWCVANLIRYIAPIWRQVPAPQTWMLYADYEDRLLMRSVLCDSLGWADPMIARQVLSEAMSLQARRAFLVCFTGVEPLALTDYEHVFLGRLADTLDAAGVSLMDCLLVGEAGFLSLNQSGQMDDVRQRSRKPWLHERYVEEDGPWTESPDS